MEYNKSVIHKEELNRTIASDRNKLAAEENFVTDLKYKLENLYTQLAVQNKEVNCTNSILQFNYMIILLTIL